MTNRLTERQRLALALCLAALIILSPDLAHAQTGDAIVQWVVTTFGRPLLNAGIIIVAICFLLLRFSAGIVVGVAAGGLVFANRDVLAGMFGM